MRTWRFSGRFLFVILVLIVFVRGSSQAQQAAPSGGPPGTEIAVQAPQRTYGMQGMAFAYDQTAGLTFESCQAQKLANLAKSNSKDSKNSKWKYSKNEKGDWNWDMIQAVTESGTGALGSAVTGGKAAGTIGAAGTPLAQFLAGGGTCDMKNPGDTKPVECAAYNSGEKFSKDTMKHAIDEVKEDAELAECQARSTMLASATAGCLGDEIAKMRKDAAKVRKDFDEARSSDEKYIQGLDQAITAENNKAEGMKSKVGQINQAMKEINDVMKDFRAGGTKGEKSSSMAGFNSTWRALEAERKSLDGEKAKAVTKKTAGCIMDRDGPQYKSCQDSSGTTLSPYKCLETFYKNAQIDSLRKGSKASGGVEYVANKRWASFKARVDDMMTELSGGKGTTPSVDTWLVSQKKLLGSYDPIAQATLQRFFSAVQECKSLSDTAVTEDASDAGGYFGKKYEDLNSRYNSLSDDIGSRCDDVGSAFRKAYTALAGDAPPASYIPPCGKVAVEKNGATTWSALPIQTQKTNLETLGENVNRMTNGSLPCGETCFTLSVPNVTVPVTCSGLEQCSARATLYQTAFETNAKNMAGDTAFYAAGCPQTGCPGKKAFIKQKNSEYRNYLTTVASNMEQRMNVLDGQIQRVKTLLSANGVNIPQSRRGEKKFGPKDACAAKNNDDDLCEMPGNFADILLDMGGMSLDPESLERAAEKVQAKADEKSKKASQLKVNAMQLEAKLTVCEKAASGKKALKGPENYLDELNKALDVCITNGVNENIDEALTNVKGSFDKVKTQADLVGQECSKLRDADEETKKACKSLQDEASAKKEKCSSIFAQVRDAKMKGSRNDKNNSGTGAAKAD